MKRVKKMMSNQHPSNWTLDHAILQNAAKNPDKIAIIFENENITYAELDKKVKKTVIWMRRHLKKGDRFACLSMNHPNYFVLLLAAAQIGVTMVALNWRLSNKELDYQICDSAPRMVIFGSEFNKKVREIIPSKSNIQLTSIEVIGDSDGLSLSDQMALKKLSEPTINVGLDEPLLIVYTSGTTGRPKGAVLSQRAMKSNSVMSHHAYDMEPNDVILNVLPLFHVGGLNIHSVPALIKGSTVILCKVFDASVVLANIEKDYVTLMNTVPTILKSLISHPGWSKTNISNIKMFSIGSTDVPISIIKEVHSRGIPVVQIYGATETAPSAIYQTRDIAFNTVGSLGKAGCDNEIRLVDSNGVDVKNGSVGEIWVKGNNVFNHYLNNSNATNLNKTEGWFHTGDLAKQDASGLYWFSGRLKHVIISGGENIYPAELERLLIDHPQLVEFSIVGRNDEHWGQVPVIVAVRRDPEVRAEDILKIFDSKIARFKRPKEVVFVNKLPRNALEKISVEQVVALLN